MSLRSDLQSLAATFADSVLPPSGAASLEELLAESGTDERRGPGRPPKSKAAPAPAAPRARKPGRLPRRSPEQIAKALDQVVALVKGRRMDCAQGFALARRRPRRGFRRGRESDGPHWHRGQLPRRSAARPTRHTGCAVTLTCRMRRLSSESTKNTYSTLNVTVGTVRKSIAMVPARCVHRNVPHVVDGGRRGASGRLGMYLATVSLLTS
jgi:hypothetical protein